MLTEIEILHQLQQIDSGDVWVYYDGNPEWFDDVVYKCTNGWTINANIRRGAFNYIDQITTPDGRTADFDQIAKMPSVYSGWYPADEDHWGLKRPEPIDWSVYLKEYAPAKGMVGAMIQSQKRLAKASAYVEAVAFNRALFSLRLRSAWHHACAIFFYGLAAR